MAAEDPRPSVALDAPPRARDIRDATLIKQGDLFLLTDLEGNAPCGNTDGFGLYHRDTRYLSGLELSIAGLKSTILLSSSPSPFLSAQVLTNPNLALPGGRLVYEQTLQVRRYRVIKAAEVAESLTFENYNAFPITLDIALDFAADFADVFEIRGIARDVERGVLHPPVLEDDALVFRYDGRDGVSRATRVLFEPAPTAVRATGATYTLELQAGGLQRVALKIRIAEHDSRAPEVHTPLPRGPGERGRRLLASPTRIETSNELFNAMLAQSELDLRVLLGGTEEEPFLCAGVPWYATLLGRDSLVAAQQRLWLSPELARHTLRLLARWQGRRDDPARDEEPGKIMHELRRGELANLGVIPFAPYYGTIDATLLWIRLLADHYRTTAELELVRELRAPLEAALGWIEQCGDLDGDGFVEYRARSARGLVNQGWKDSWDGIVHADGSLPEPPIALCEVQGYLYAALRGAATLYEALGEPGRARELERRAALLSLAFERAFWMPGAEFYAMALDGSKRQLSSIGSNAGHALACGLVGEDRAELVARRLMTQELFTGFGIRTLSLRERRYNPAGYHVGAVWPHDTAIAGLGLKRAGQEALLAELFTGLYEAAQHFPSLRVPELFCGFARTGFGVPVRYPVACSPQAWAAGAWFSLLQATLGILPLAPTRELRIARPTLPPWLDWVEARGLAVGSAEVDLRYQRVGEHTAVDVRAMRGDVRVSLVSAWDPDVPLGCVEPQAGPSRKVA